MWNIFANNFINFFDYFYKKKIFNFLKKKNIENINIFFDVGAHKGESIKSFANTFKIDENTKDFNQFKYFVNSIIKPNIHHTLKRLK